MRNAILLPMIFGLAGCVGLSPAIPQAARMTQSELIVTLSDATVCRAPISATGAAGQLTACGPGFAYEVEIVRKPNLLRQMAEAAFGALGAEGQLAPIGRVTLTDSAGKRYDFVSPVPILPD